MKYLWGVLVAMGVSILALFRMNSSLRTKNKIKDLDQQDTNLKNQQENIKQKKGKLSQELVDLKKTVSNEKLTSSQIEEFWKNKDSK